MKFKDILGLVVSLATPQTLTSVKAVLGTLAKLGHLKNADGTDITKEQLGALWDEARSEFRTLGDEARASNAEIQG